MFLATHRHVGGGLYQYIGEMQGKYKDGGWQIGVAYRNEEGMLFWTDHTRWGFRFEPIEDSVTTSLSLLDDQDEHLATVTFQRVEAGDVRHLIMSAGVQPNSVVARDWLNWFKTVMGLMAEQIEIGLHLRAHDFPDLIGDVAAFHAKFGQEYTGKPRRLPADLHDFRCGFHDEETSEYRDEYPKLLDAIERGDRRDIISSLEQQLDALVDAAWVLLGTADLQFGRDRFHEAWRRVVKANMAKVRKDSTTDGDGSVDSGRQPKYDIVKPAGWLPPDHRDLVEDNAIFDELFGTKADEVDIETNGTAQEVSHQIQA